MSETRYVPVRAGFWWRIKIGDGTAFYGKFHTEKQAQEMCALLRREWLNGEFAERARAERLAVALQGVVSDIHCKCSVRERDSGHRVDCAVPALLEQIDAALAE